jgi:hypothetical protein
LVELAFNQEIDTFSSVVGVAFAGDLGGGGKERGPAEAVSVLAPQVPVQLRVNIYLMLWEEKGLVPALTVVVPPDTEAFATTT